ncbi:MAG: radical SAM protein [Deltaproteobacteria bacterium RIFCSPLOWO2_02_FULL_50_16]|nr:MAG: radical SAM protein [Deltaproteobacteria bacterium RIFCSPLOWO2_02_FULL_50_16]
MSAVAKDQLKKMQEEVKTQEAVSRLDPDRFYQVKEGQLASGKLEQGGFRLVERLLVGMAKVFWPLFRFINKVTPPRTFQPAWAPAPLLKNKEKSRPVFGWPRTTDSLCPGCVKEARQRILSGDKDYTHLINDNPGAIKADIIEREGRIMMVKECPKHGHFEDVLSIDPKFLKRVEDLFPGRDFKSPLDTMMELRNHGKSSVKYGRGSVLTIDLTNRCNMMCEPCFMDANQVGYVHELSLQEIKQFLDNAVKIKPKRQLSVQFSGGEPTLSPHFLEAVRYAKEVGYFSVQAATNGIVFANDPEFAKKAYEAGMRIAYLQFDGASNASNSHRKITNLFDVKLRAIENLYKAGIDVVLVVTIVNSVNNEQVGRIVDFAIQNCDKITFVAFQPVSFTGRDEDVSDEDRQRMRYTTSHLVHDIKRQTGVSEPLRDWYPFSASGPFSDLADLMSHPNSIFGTMKCGCHPDCGVVMAIWVDKQTKRWLPVSEFINLDRVLEDIKAITDAQQPRWLTKLEVLSSLLRNFRPSKAPKDITLQDFLRKFDKQTGGGIHAGKVDYGVGAVRKQDRWHFMFVGSMWFQDLFTYDFRRTEMCIIPYATQLGEISFCAYNTGVGWRQIIENMFKTASVAEWNKKFGRHNVYAGDRPMPVPNLDHTVKLPSDTDAAIH